MSTPGSYYGWVFPATRTRDETLDYFTGTLRSLGIQVERTRAEAVCCIVPTGQPQNFRLFFTSSPEGTPHRVIYTISSGTWFRPMELEDHPGTLPVTQADYDFAKQVFNLSDATECFGFHASQDNPVAFEDSNLDFFFLKDGPQLALAHLDARRILLPGEEDFTISVEDYEPFLSWDKKLHSGIFTRFSGEIRMRRAYNAANRLIEKSWCDYYQPSQPPS